jgi:hypothetical protein
VEANHGLKLHTSIIFYLGEGHHIVTLCKKVLVKFGKVRTGHSQADVFLIRTKFGFLQTRPVEGKYKVVSCAFANCMCMCVTVFLITCMSHSTHSKQFISGLYVCIFWHTCTCRVTDDSFLMGSFLMGHQMSQLTPAIGPANEYHFQTSVP